MEAAPAEEAADATAPAPETEEKAEAPATADNEAGKALYAKCASCHGADGKTKALGKSEVLAGQSAADLETKIAEYKAGTRNVAGMGALMKGQVATMSDEDIKAVSAYIATF
ncbi:c-type cytochrome [Sulfurovum mangrovi]|uniref:c-type cytochrome n=1 Tax=Sulfurovum mangrovi TaxID=2893889 RepID=UPI001E6211ED|nr:c-type cytochrome [Sulfurovum mangrovi]UFH60653.1 c-type cytochrome [Sulfurovum mangrovi]